MGFFNWNEISTWLFFTSGYRFQCWANDKYKLDCLSYTFINCYENTRFFLFYNVYQPYIVIYLLGFIYLSYLYGHSLTAVKLWAVYDNKTIYKKNEITTHIHFFLKKWKDSITIKIYKPHGESKRSCIMELSKNITGSLRLTTYDITRF